MNPVECSYLAGTFVRNLERLIPGSTASFALMHAGFKFIVERQEPHPHLATWTVTYDFLLFEFAGSLELARSRLVERLDIEAVRPRAQDFAARMSAVDPDHRFRLIEVLPAFFMIGAAPTWALDDERRDWLTFEEIAGLDDAAIAGLARRFIEFYSGRSSERGGKSVRSWPPRPAEPAHDPLQA